MAKTGVFDGDQNAIVARAKELKKELKRLVRVIAEEDDGWTFEAIDRAKQTLCELKELKRSPTLKLNESPLAIPPEFRCPLSKELMRDPVVVATGQTYDRPFIQKWLNAGNRTCPIAQQVLSHTIITPNHLIRELISQWCKNNGVQFPKSPQYSVEGGITEPDRDLFFSLLERMSSNLSEQKEAARTLRSLTKKMPSFRALFGEFPDAIPQLLNPLSQIKIPSEINPDLQEHLITSLLNISIHDDNKKIVAEMPTVIPLILDALTSGTVETKSNAAATLFTLSALDSNKELIGRAGALKPLIGLLEEGHPSSMKDVASAIFNLCIVHENKARAVSDGAIIVLFDKIANRIHVDELLVILAMLSSNQKAVEEMKELGAVPSLLCLMRESTCARSKENCIAIIYALCYNDRIKWKELRDEESTYGSFSLLAQNGTLRAKRKASGILERLGKAANITHTA